MENQEINKSEYVEIDLLHILKTLWKKIGVIIVSGVLAAVIGFSYATFFVAPKYSANIKLYVNNNSTSANNGSYISSAQIMAAQSLVKTYGEILGSRTTLERIANQSGVKYNSNQLSSMIKYKPLNETEIMLVEVTCEDSFQASKIANTIAKILPDRIAEIIDGASVELVDKAVPNAKKVSPNVANYTVIALVLGVFLSAAVIVVIALLDDTIHDEEYVNKTYDIAILGKVPALSGNSNKMQRLRSVHNKIINGEE